MSAEVDHPATVEGSGYVVWKIQFTALMSVHQTKNGRHAGAAMNVEIREILENTHRHRKQLTRMKTGGAHNQQAAHSSAHNELWQRKP